jgi:hypothetical protein
VFTRLNESNQPVSHYFCPECGTTLAAESPKYPAVIIIKYGTLESRDGLEAVEAHIFRSWEEPWLESLYDNLVQKFSLDLGVSDR